jgi:hypothetical protein
VDSLTALVRLTFFLRWGLVFPVQAPCHARRSDRSLNIRTKIHNFCRICDKHLTWVSALTLLLDQQYSYLMDLVSINREELLAVP